MLVVRKRPGIVGPANIGKIRALRPDLVLTSE
jgi:hypothetical protein